MVLEFEFMCYKDLSNKLNILCCGQSMIVRNGTPKHNNDSPFTLRCKVCKRWFKGNGHFFDVPRPQHAVLRIKEVKSK